MFARYKTLGIILVDEDRKEADKLFTVFTKDFGKLKILGKGIRKIKSKLRAGTQPFYLSEIEFIQGKAYKTLTDAAMVKNFENLRKDLTKLKFACKIAENINALVRDIEVDEELWKLVVATFRNLDKCSNSDSSCFFTYYYFLWNFLSRLGYKPELDYCTFCQKKLSPENLYFNSEQGGIICNSCFKELKIGKKISLELVKIIRFLLREDWKILYRLKINLKDKKELEKVSEIYLSYLISILSLS